MYTGRHREDAYHTIILCTSVWFQHIDSFEWYHRIYHYSITVTHPCYNNHSPVSQLAEPDEGLRIFNLLCNHLLNNISGMHIDGTDGHDSLSVSFWEITKEKVDESIELIDLLLVVVLQRCLKPFLHPIESYVHLCSPPDLSASKCHLQCWISTSIIITSNKILIYFEWPWVQKQ